MGYDGLVLHWDGVAWNEVDAGATGRLRGVWASGPDDIWAVGTFAPDIRNTPDGWEQVDHNIVLHYDGTGWTVQQVSGTTFSTYAVFATPTRVFAGGLDGSIQHLDR